MFALEGAPAVGAPDGHDVAPGRDAEGAVALPPVEMAVVENTGLVQSMNKIWSVSGNCVRPKPFSEHPVILWEYSHRVGLVESFKSHFVSSKMTAYQESWSRTRVFLVLIQAILFTGNPVANC